MHHYNSNFPLYSGIGVFSDRSGHDCPVHIKAFLAMNCLAYAVSFLTCVFAVYRLHGLGHLRIRLILGLQDTQSQSTRGAKREQTRAVVQRILLTVIALSLCACSHFSFFGLL